MQTISLLLIILSALIALGIAWFQYHYKSKKKGKVYMLLSFLRFLALWGIGLLLINPKFSKDEFTLEKTDLVLLSDNSSSINDSFGKKALDSILDRIKGNENVSSKFNLHPYHFGTDLNSGDSLSLNEPNTNISKALKTIQDIHNSNSAIVLLTDGNQTIGENYEFYGSGQGFPVYPIIIGDTTRYEDLRIGQVNSNKFAFLKNKYPIEVYVTYEGPSSITSQIDFSINGETIHRQRINLSASENTIVVRPLLEANTVGLKNVAITVAPLTDEKNTANNKKNIAIEVMDEKTNVGIVSNMSHPDIGALTKAIESNEQRSVTLIDPSSNESDYDAMDLFILYQPNSTFTRTYDFLANKKSSIFTITGAATDWRFLNRVQQSFDKNNSNVSEDVSPILNSGFSIFDISDFGIDDFPPLESDLGEIIIGKPFETLLEQQIKGVEMGEPLWAIIPDDVQKEAVLFGENLWKWRMQTYRNTGSFETFDALIGKIMLYLASSGNKERLTVAYETIFSGTEVPRITATYYDKTYILDSQATLTIKLNGENGYTKEIPMLSKGNSYEMDVSDLSAGTYDFTITVANESLTKSGRFTIMDFNVEKQFLSTDDDKLIRLAQNTNGKPYFPSEIDQLIEELSGNEQFVPVQKSKQNVVSLIDFRLLLGVIVSALAAEWFIRKYNGLI